MRIRRASPLLLLLTPSLVVADAAKKPADGVEVLSNDDILSLNRAPNDARVADSAPDSTNNAKSTSTARPYKGTEDAPVDGQDGKPKIGPFVDTTPDEVKTKNGEPATTTSKSVPTSLKNLEETMGDIPEKNDGVMNDENRPVPKKGTTGTEGGISEKEKLRKGQDGQVENKPQEPKEAPPIPQSEQKHLDGDEKKGPKSSDKKTTDATTTKDGKDPITGEKTEGKKDKGDGYGDGIGMEKPKDLPEKPHNIPHPDPKIATSPDDDFGPPVNGEGKNKWLVETMPDTEGKTNPKPPKSKSNSPSGSTTTTPSLTPGEEESWHEWFHSFVLSFTMIIFSEIGDKTFLVAALMAMRHARVLVFSAALSALIAMTILSAVLGHAFPTLLPKKFTTFAAAILFFVFGAKSLREGLAMSKHAGVGDEMREVEAELEEKEHTMRRKSKGDLLSPYELESGRGRSPGFDKMGRPEPSPPMSRSPSPPRGKKDRFGGLMNLLGLVLSPAWVQTFVMTFLGEWGDRSQIATIAMAAGQDYWWVTLGAIVGHACCTGIAVIGGRALAGRVSMRVVTIGGAVAFLVFGCIYLYECIVD
ncbi:hypothetical protein M409DRAFT_54415 [Zasmidium cellare ATCC 36951]|uniref:Uncharacterized protein n=1 Tax=Zasmidium cellare ATCC 36951 TaxID=1080233 RepID=A0A6A6CNA9_ZASCE|nr:uncharacterized protein M409DRAFT_54415 [Zasmidium cellare ATCC 36951]KAF2167229.1 hypothetical protein M409DRAFT_54415 [Zasmidium cellare ATCC 36951]